MVSACLFKLATLSSISSFAPTPPTIVVVSFVTFTDFALPSISNVTSESCIPRSSRIASLSTSSAMIRSSFPPVAVYSRSGRMSLILEVFLSVIRIYGSFIVDDIIPARLFLSAHRFYKKEHCGCSWSRQQKQSGKRDNISKKI